MRLLIVLLAYGVPAFSQGMTLVGLGGPDGGSIGNTRIVPGEIVTLEVANVKTVLPSSVLFQAHATSLPLPASIAGFSVTIQNQYNGTFTAPLLAVGQGPLCQFNRTSPDCLLTSLMIQIPWEITPPPADPPMETDILINDNGTQSEPFFVGVDMDHLQILKTCTGSLSLACVTHADGTIVSANAPAQPGEVLVVYALGLGPISNTPKTGNATPMPSATQALSTVSGSVAIQFDFRPNASPSRPFVSYAVPSPGITNPLFAGLTPGQVGVYQINLKLPDAFPAVPPCPAVTSNLTIDIGYQPSTYFVDSFDGAAICVQSSQ